MVSTYSTQYGTPDSSFNTGNKLAFAFATLPDTKSKFKSKSTSNKAQGIDIRKQTQADRQMLIKGHRLRVFAGEAFITDDFPLPLFNATSTKAEELVVTDIPILTSASKPTKAELLVRGRITLSANIDRRGILMLLNYLKEMIFWRKGDLRMPSEMGISDMLNVTAAAQALGMDKYVDHVYRKCEAFLRNLLPEYHDLDALVMFSEHHPRFLRVTASNLAERMRENTIPDEDIFAAYLDNKPVLKIAIEATEVEFVETCKRNREFEETHKLRVQNAIARAAATEQARISIEQAKVEHEAREKEKATKEKAFWTKKNAESAEDEQSIKKKLQLPIGKRKFTPREAQHWRKTRGTSLPKGC
jgi:hypothetical protein